MMEKELRKEVELLVEAICNLAKVNRLTGIWDHVRFEESKNSIDKINILKMLESEKKSRFNVEQRAVYRKIIDKQFLILFKGLKN